MPTPKKTKRGPKKKHTYVTCSHKLMYTCTLISKPCCPCSPSSAQTISEQHTCNMQVLTVKPMCILACRARMSNFTFAKVQLLTLQPHMSHKCQGIYTQSCIQPLRVAKRGRVLSSSAASTSTQAPLQSAVEPKYFMPACEPSDLVEYLTSPATIELMKSSKNSCRWYRETNF